MSLTSQLSNEQTRWYALYAVRAKTELIEQLEALKGKQTLNPLNNEEYIIYDVYVPTEIRTLKTVKGLRKFRAMVVGSYVFIKATKDDIVKLKHDITHVKSDLRFVKLDRIAGSQNYAIVSDNEISNIRRALSQMEMEKVEFFQPTKVILEKGDKVRVTGGQFEGIEGILLTQQGKAGGRLVVNVSNLLAIKTISIEPEHIQILEFAKGSSRSYKNITKFCDFIDSLSSQPLSSSSSRLSSLTPNQREELINYINRYKNLKLEGKLKTRFEASMNIAYQLITPN